MTHKMSDVVIFDVRLYIFDGQILSMYTVVQIFMYVCTPQIYVCVYVCIPTIYVCVYVCISEIYVFVYVCMSDFRVFMYVATFMYISCLCISNLKFYVFGPVIFHQNSFCKSSRFYCRRRAERPWALLVDIPSRCKILVRRQFTRS